MNNQTNRHVVPKKLWIGAFIPNWLLKQTTVSANAKLMYARLSQFSDDNGRAWPRQSLLSKELGMNKRTAQRAIDVLVRLNLIKKVQRGINTSNLYTFPEHPWMSQKPLDTTDMSHPDMTDLSHPDMTDVSHIQYHIINKEKTNGTRCPETFYPDARSFEILEKKEGVSKEDSEKCISAFIDYWIAIAGARGIKRDWNATFRNWVRNESKWSAKKRTDKTEIRRRGLAIAMGRRMENG